MEWMNGPVAVDFSVCVASDKQTVTSFNIMTPTLLNRLLVLHLVRSLSAWTWTRSYTPQHKYVHACKWINGIVAVEISVFSN